MKKQSLLNLSPCAQGGREARRLLSFGGLRITPNVVGAPNADIEKGKRHGDHQGNVTKNTHHL